MQIPNLVFSGYIMVAVAMSYWGWRYLSKEALGKDKGSRWMINYLLIIGVGYFTLLEFASSTLGDGEAVTFFLMINVMPFMVSLIAFNVGYWVHMLVDSINCAPRIG